MRQRALSIPCLKARVRKHYRQQSRAGALTLIDIILSVALTDETPSEVGPPANSACGAQIDALRLTRDLHTSRLIPLDHDGGLPE